MVSANETRIAAVLGGGHQLRVPMYQRRYAWKRPEWDALWDDLAQLALTRKDNKSETHFVGSVVLAQAPVGAKPSPDLLIIDGQQRLVTMSLFLCALRDQELGLSKSLRERIIRCLYMPNHKSLGPLKRLKVLPTEHDQDAFSRVVDLQDPIHDHPVTRAYKRFLGRLQDLGKDQDESASGVAVADLARAALDGLECVYIKAEPGDNAHRIFESLNNRGMPLTQADLIRNYVFMRLDNASDDFHQYTWKPLEARFDAERLTQLFWLDLVRDRPTVTQRQTYVEQQKRLQQMETTTKLRNAIKRTVDRGDYWHSILHPELEQSKKVRLRLQRLSDWKTTTAWPTLMYLLELRANGHADSNEIARAMQHLESYFVRRVVMGRATMNMNRVLLGAPPALGRPTGAVDIALRVYLSETGKHWATDEQLRDEVASKPFYRHGRAHQKTLILKWIEEHMAGEEFELSDELTIEHVMPQTVTPLWRQELARKTHPGHDLSYLHGQLVDTLGNLTLTRQNAAMSNKSFVEKKKVLIKHGSGLAMTKEITKKHHWDPDAIRARSTLMVERIIKNWPGPLPT